MKIFFSKFILSLIFILFSTSVVTAATSIIITPSNVTSSGAFLNISGATPLTTITVYVFNDPNSSNSTSYSQNIDVTTDNLGKAGVNFLLPAGKSFTATTSLSSGLTLVTFSTPPVITTVANPTSISVKAGTLTSTSVTITASGILVDNSYIFSVFNAANYPNGSPIINITVNKLESFSPVETPITGLTPGQAYVVVLDPNNTTGGWNSQYSSPVKVNFTTIAATPGVGTTAPTSNNSPFTKIVPDCGQVVTTTDPVTGKDVSTMATPCNFEFFMQLINNIIKFLLVVMAVPIVALIIMYTGYLYITAGGNASQTEKAKGIMFKVVIGFVIALAAWLIINTIITSFNLDPTINTFLVK
jgi:hypothetical protein